MPRLLAAAPGVTGQRWHLSDLNKSLKRHMHVLYRLGYSNQESVYSTRHGSSSCQGWTDQLAMPIFAGRRASLAEQAGESNNVVLARGCTYMMGKRRTDKCAQCKTKPDTVHHTLNAWLLMYDGYIYAPAQ